MNINVNRTILLFFVIFFVLQLVFGEAGVISFIQQKKITEKYYKNVNELVQINNNLLQQAKLSQSNKSYVLMNAHRVGLLAENEYLIKSDDELHTEYRVYSPGSFIIEKEIFHLKNIFLFIFAILFIGLSITSKIIYNYMKIKRLPFNEIVEEKQLDTSDNDDIPFISATNIATADSILKQYESTNRVTSEYKNDNNSQLQQVTNLASEIASEFTRESAREITSESLV